MITLIIILMFLATTLVFANYEEKHNKFVAMPITLRLHDSKYNIRAVHDAAKVVFITNRVLADLATAQAILESNLYGKPSKLALYSKNLFGIADVNGTDGMVLIATHEYYNGSYHMVMKHFSQNKTLEDSFRQYKNLILEKKRYSNIKKAATFEDAAIMVQHDGWATDPTYSIQLINVYKKYVKPLD